MVAGSKHSAGSMRLPDMTLNRSLVRMMALRLALAGLAWALIEFLFPALIAVGTSHP